MKIKDDKPTHYQRNTKKKKKKKQNKKQICPIKHMKMKTSVGMMKPSVTTAGGYCCSVIFYCIFSIRDHF